MLLAGDEIGHTQQGNNNAYCQDDELSWVDWEGIGDEGRALITFVRKLIAIRASFPVLRRSRFFAGAFHEELGVRDCTWLTPTGSEIAT